MKTRILPFVFFAALVLAHASLARASGPALASGKIPDDLRAAFVTVEITPQSFEGEDPQAGNLANALRMESTVGVGSYLVAPDLVLVADDACFPARFVRSYRVRQGENVVDARVVARAAERSSLLLKLEKPLPGARPLKFVEPVEGAGLSLHWTVDNAPINGWKTIMRPLSAAELREGENGATYYGVPGGAIIATSNGLPVSITSGEWMKADGSWKTPWKNWKWIWQDDYAKRLEKISAFAEKTIISADIKLRPLPVRAGDNPYQGYGNQDNDPSKKPQPAVVLSSKRVLVLASMAPAFTARLEGVTLRFPGAKLADEKRVEARFVASLADYGAFVVEPVEPLEAALVEPNAAAAVNWAAFRDHLLLTIDFRLQGENRVARAGCARLLNIERGWKGRVTPIVSEQGPNVFLFDNEGNFLGCSLMPRSLTQERFYGARAHIVSADVLATFARDAGAWADTTNIPVAEKEERQLVWLGVDMQSLTRELAQALGVAEQTQNGNSGALVTNVYPDSPAARCGLKTGDVLLRMRRQGNTQIIPIRPGYAMYGGSFMMANQQIPDSMYDRLPQPWPPADNSINQKLKEIGVGKVFEIDYARDGEFATVTFTAEKGPDYFATADESTFAKTGLNVKSLTFETRSFYKVADGKSALIVSRVVAGSKASVAGLRPYDLIVEVNDQPVKTPAEFSEVTKSGGKLRLLTRRMSQTRIVTLEIDESQDASEAAKTVTAQPPAPTATKQP